MITPPNFNIGDLVISIFAAADGERQTCPVYSTDSKILYLKPNEIFGICLDMIISDHMHPYCHVVQVLSSAGEIFWVRSDVVTKFE